MIPDADLAIRAVAGDQPAFVELVVRHTPRLHRWLCATGLRASDADDVVQDAFIRVHRHLDRYDVRRPFPTWLFAIAHRLRLDLIARRRVHAPLDAGQAAPESAVPPPFPSGSLWERVRQLLPERSFQALWLHYGEDMDPAAVAEVLGITGIHARVLLHRTRKRLATALAGDGWATALEGSLP